MHKKTEKKAPGSFHDRVAGFFAQDGAFARACASTPFPFEIRPQQQEMASAVAAALTDSEHLAVEAGTGVGKTFAYLVPLILSAVENNRRLACHASRVAVSTHTINLQEQLMFKDIPFLMEHMGVEFRAALCKGRGNYICLRRLESANLMSGDLFNKGREKEFSRIRKWVRHLENPPAHGTGQNLDGSLSNFTEGAPLPFPEVWRQVCSEHDNCLGRKCNYYTRCFLMKARAAAADADLLILNHHLFFSDLALRQSQSGLAGGGGILPAFSAIVIDEAHNLEDVAGEHLGLRLSQGGMHHWLRRLYTPATGKGLLAALKEFEIADEAGRVWESVDHFFMEVASWANLDGSRNNTKRIMDEKHSFKTMLMEQVAALVRRLEGLREATQDEAVKAELNAITRRGDEIRLAIDFFLKEKEKNYVYWVEREGFARLSRGSSGGAPARLALVSAPVDVAPLLNDLLFKSFAPVVLTSATLSVGGSLDFFKNRIGVEHCRDLVVGSPFDYQRQMKLFIVGNMPEPKDAEFPGAVANAVAHFVRKSAGRAFVLFTNAELMRKVAASLEGFFTEEGLLALVQGDGLPRHAMLKKFRETHEEMQDEDNGLENDETDNAKFQTPNSTFQDSQSQIENHQPRAGPPVAEKSKISKAVLFGLDSFWMGVDVRGEALSNVIIVRLPFAVPDEPLVKARLDRLTAEGKDAFREYSLPQAILKFRQGVGRLIRTATDEGIIAILDSRIIRRWYGKYFLRSIPECPVEHISLNDDHTPEVD